MSDTPRSPKHTSRTSRSGSSGGTGGRTPSEGGAGRRGSSTWVGGSSSGGLTKGGASSAAATGAAGKDRRSSRAAKDKKKATTARRAGFWGAIAGALNYPRRGKSGALRWFPSLRLIVGVVALFVVLGVGGAAWLYAVTDVPEEDQIAVAQTSRVYFSDGTTEMGTFSEVNRTILPNDEIPQNVKDAVVASEDSTFYENRGVSPRGIVRALVNNVKGGARQGGSTITQQYVERYYTGTTTSYTGKVKEMIMALKIDQELPKDEILSRYLNTIYFGRGAYGIQAASQAYFGKDAKDLTDSEAALLVAVIPAPSSYDPAVNHDEAVKRWKRVIEREVNVTKTLTSAQADAIEFTEPQAPAPKNNLGGTNGYLLKMVESELKREGIPEDELNQGGFTIVSSIDKSIQDNTVQAIEDLPSDRPANNHVGTVTIDPSTGAIRALYGGADYVTQGRSDATQSHMQGGSIFKTFTLLAALQDGYSLNSTWNGNSPHQFPGWKVKNFSDVSYGNITLTEATTHSVNTAYAALNLDMGPEKTKQMAITMGLPEDTPGLDDNQTNVLGTASPTVMNMATAYSTVAAQGVHRTPYIVQKVTTSDGAVRYEHQDDAKQVIDRDIAINATVALQGPPSSSGSADYVADHMNGREVAGKTGTSESFKSAWFVGFTPQLVTAVGMFQPSADGTVEEQLTPFGGESSITGGTFPTEVWVGIMKPSLQGQEKLDFPSAVSIKSKKKGNASSSSRSSTTQKQTTEAPTTTTEAPSTTTEAPTTEAPTTTTEAPQQTPQTTTEAPRTPQTTQAPQQTTGQNGNQGQNGQNSQNQGQGRNQNGQNQGQDRESTPAREVDD